MLPVAPNGTGARCCLQIGCQPAYHASTSEGETGNPHFDKWGRFIYGHRAEYARFDEHSRGEFAAEHSCRGGCRVCSFIRLIDGRLFGRERTNDVRAEGAPKPGVQGAQKNPLFKNNSRMRGDFAVYHKECRSFRSGWAALSLRMMCRSAS